MTMILLRKPRNRTRLMLSHPPLQIIRHANIQRTVRLIRENVYIILLEHNFEGIFYPSVIPSIGLVDYL